MGNLKKSLLFLCLCLAMAHAGACSGVPAELSAVVLTLDLEDQDAACGLVYVSLRAGADEESWGFLTDGRFPHTEEFHTGLEGLLTAEATGYACAGGDCRDARREELVVSRGSAGLMASHGLRTSVTIVLEQVFECGNAVVEPGEECDAGDPAPLEPCLGDCTYPLYEALDRAGGAGDGLVMLPHGPGFAAAWTVGAGDDAATPDGLSLMLFDDNGRPLTAVAQEYFPSSCLDGQDPVFSAFDPAGWGGDSAEALVVWREQGESGREGLCLTRIDPAAGTDETLGLGESLPLTGKSPVARIGTDHMAAALIEADGIVVVVTDMGSGLESGRALVPGTAFGPVRLASLDGRLLAAAWQETDAAGAVSTWFMRWRAAGGALERADPSPVLAAQGSGAEARGIELLAPAGDAGGFILTIATAAAVETAWIAGDGIGQEFDWVSSVGAAMPDDVLAEAAAADSRSLFVLMAAPAGSGDRCTYKLVEIFSPGLGGGWRLASSWGPDTDLGCRTGLAALGAGRAAAGFLTLHETAPGRFEGALSIDISR